MWWLRRLDAGDVLRRHGHAGKLGLIDLSYGVRPYRRELRRLQRATPVACAFEPVVTLRDADQFTGVVDTE
jgi:hypothetical protein